MRALGSKESRMPTTKFFQLYRLSLVKRAAKNNVAGILEVFHGILISAIHDTPSESLVFK